LPVHNSWYVLLQSGGEKTETLKNAEAVWVINEWEAQAFTSRENMFPFLLANFMPSGIKAKDLTFEWLAEKSVGANKLGVMRLDVDNLGRIMMGKGFTEEDKSLLRLSTLSRNLSLFFKLYITSICCGKSLPQGQTRVIDLPQSQERKVIIIYSGGDDAFLVGAWSDVIELAFDLHDAFLAYTGNNPDITLSAGMLALSPEYPLYRFAEEAGLAEKAAKRNQDNGKSKDSLAPLYQSLIFTETGAKSALFWAENGEVNAKSILSLARELVEELGTKGEDGSFELKPGARAFIYKLFSVIEARKELGKLYLPALAYAIARTRLSDSLERRLLNTETIKYLHPALMWVELLGRGE